MSENTLHGLRQRPRSSFFSHLVYQAVVKLFKITILPCRLCSFPGMRLNLHHWAFRVEEVNWGREFYSPVKAVTNFWRNKIYVIITHSNYFSVSVGFNPPDNSSWPVSTVGFKPFTDKLRTCLEHNLIDFHWRQSVMINYPRLTSCRPPWIAPPPSVQISILY